MIDRDPVPSWVDGHVALLGDAAHVMYPVGSNGASQAIVDARVLGAAMVAHGAAAEALRAYDDQLCADISALGLRNRGAGPFGILGLVDERCAACFDDIDAVIPAAERDAFMAATRARPGSRSRRSTPRRRRSRRGVAAYAAVLVTHDAIRHVRCSLETKEEL